MEVVALLTAMKEMGFEAGHILSLIVMYFLLRRDVLKTVDKIVNDSFEKLISAIKSLEETHNKRLQKIEDHVGLK